MLKLPFKNPRFLTLFCFVIAVIALELLALAGIKLPMPYAPLLFGAITLGVGHEVLKSGLKALFKLKFSSINLLMLIAVVGAFYLGEYPEAALVIVLYVFGESLESIGIDNSKSALGDLVKQSPKKAFVKALSMELPIDQVAIGTLIQIKPGEMIPLDGIVRSGESSVNQAAITGESIPKECQTGDEVFAGTLNQTGFIEVETTKTSADTTFSKIIRLTFEAQANKSESQRFIERFSRYYTPAILLLALLLLLIPVFILHQDFNHWLQQSISLLVIACPCALVISTPVTIYAAMGNASAKGALIKGGKYLEALAEIKSIAFDKTGTLTTGAPVLSDVIPLNEFTKQQVLAYAAGISLFSEHPLAGALVKAADQQAITPQVLGRFKNVPGNGTKALYEHREQICLGKSTFISEQTGRDTGEADLIINRLAAEGKSCSMLAVDGNLAGILAFSDDIKPEATQALTALQRMGVQTHMLSGDSQQAAEAIGRSVGIDHVFGNLLPEEKVSKMQELLKKYEKVAMVGDGVNDAAALAQSTVGIAMAGTGSDAAIETANVALMNDHLNLIPYLIRLSKATVKQIRMNTIGAITVKALVIALAIMGHSSLALAIVADVGVLVGIILLSLRLARFE